LALDPGNLFGQLLGRLGLLAHPLGKSLIAQVDLPAQTPLPEVAVVEAFIGDQLQMAILGFATILPRLD
jgi:hypothetical protein